METFEFAIIGAGFAGAATAYHLTRRGANDIVILEQENIPGFHSSGRNAAMVRQCVPDPDLATLTRDGAAFLRALPATFLFLTAWSVGEAVGYLRGPAPSPENRTSGDD